MSQTPLWLDCDPGHDDAFAMLMAAHHPSLRLLGISTVHGNASLRQTTRNAESILTALGRTNIPIYPGAAKPFCRNAVHAADIHGKTGLDGTDRLPTPISKAAEQSNAILAMKDALLAEQHNVPWIVATGALTNVALLFATFPELVRHIRGLSIMGGAVGNGFTDATLGNVAREDQSFGNRTPWAEFNIYCDPEGAEAIFSNQELASKTTLVPLDLTHKVIATHEVQQRMLQDEHGPSYTKLANIRPLFFDLLIFFAKTYREVFGLVDGPPLHDPVAVAILLDDSLDGSDPDFLNFDDREGERWHITVVTDGKHSSNPSEEAQVGRTIATRLRNGEAGVRIPRNLDIAKFWDIVDDCMRRAEIHIIRS